MGEDERRSVARGAVDRRDVLIKGATAGAVAWTAPVVVSLASPAAAASAGPPPPPPPPPCTTFAGFTTLASLTRTSSVFDGVQFIDTSATLPMISGTDLRLIDGTNDTVAAAWLTARQNVGGGFTSSFDFRMTGDGDGLAFVVQDDSVTAVGLGGGFLGYGGGIPRSLAVECDITFNPGWDPNDNHIAVHSAGTATNVADGSSPSLTVNQTASSLASDLNDGSVHTLTVVYDALAAPHHMTVSLDSTTVLSFDVDLAAELNLAPDGTAWVGFTAGTGSLAAALDIVSWSFCPVAA